MLGGDNLGVAKHCPRAPLVLFLSLLPVCSAVAPHLSPLHSCIFDGHPTKQECAWVWRDWLAEQERGRTLLASLVSVLSRRRGNAEGCTRACGMYPCHAVDSKGKKIRVRDARGRGGPWVEASCFNGCGSAPVSTGRAGPGWRQTVRTTLMIIVGSTRTFFTFIP